jgi:LTXXQ motif family protein
LAGHAVSSHGRFAHNQVGRDQLAHNQHNDRFHGVNNFTRNGFNRNAFGKQEAWNQWGRNHWGHGWNNWGNGSGFWTGSVFWPFFWGDVLTSWLWPYAYYDPFWAYGPNFILTSVFWPGPYYGGYYAWPYGHGYAGLSDIYGYGRYGRAVHNNHMGRVTRQPAVPSTNVAETCGGLAPGVTDLPVDRIEEAVRPTADQMTAFEYLKAASSKATEDLKSSCPSEVPLTPVGRLDAMKTRFDAMLQAVQVMRTPLEDFYNSLTDEQKQRFQAIGGGAEQTRGRDELATLCNDQSGSFTQLPLERIDQIIQPTRDQQSALDQLNTTSSKAASELQASCPTGAPSTPGERLDAITKRLNSMIQAADIVRPALESFYASLNDEQKARFNAMGQPQGQTTSQARGRPD